MNLIENEEVTKKNSSKTIMIMISALIVLLIVISIILVYVIYDIQKNTLKLAIDGKTISTFEQNMFVTEDNTVYISIKDFAPLIGYEVQNGDHKSEDKTKGYIVNSYEEASFTLDSNKIYKTLLTGTDSEYFDIENPIKMINDKLYISAEGIQIAANCAISHDSKNNKYTVYTLPYLAQYYTNSNTDSAVGDEKADFSNQKALLYNMIVVKNATGKYGVRSLDGQEIIGTKYASIQFVESSKEFIVTTDERKMGILTATGSTKIQPDYDDIKQIDKDLNLFLVKNNNKYGVINQKGTTVLYLEYDKIGIDIAQYNGNKINNQYLLFNNCIPVQKNKKWGLYDKNGNQIVAIEYDELGCKNGSQFDAGANSIVIIPDQESIILMKDKKYGIVDATGKVIVPCVLDSVYSVTSSGVDTYQMIQGETKIDVSEYFEKYVTKKEQSDINVMNQADNTTPGSTVTNTNVTNEVEIPNTTVGSTNTDNSNNIITGTDTTTSNEVITNQVVPVQ